MPELNAYGGEVFEQRASYRAFETLSGELQDLVRQTVRAVKDGDQETLAALTPFDAVKPLFPEAEGDSVQLLTELEGEKYSLSLSRETRDVYNLEYLWLEVRPENGPGFAAQQNRDLDDAGQVTFRSDSWCQCACADWQWEGFGTIDAMDSMNGPMHQEGRVVCNMLDGLWTNSESEYMNKTYHMGQCGDGLLYVFPGYGAYPDDKTMYW